MMDGVIAWWRALVLGASAETAGSALTISAIISTATDTLHDFIFRQPTFHSGFRLRWGLHSTASPETAKPALADTARRLPGNVFCFRPHIAGPRFTHSYPAPSLAVNLHLLWIEVNSGKEKYLLSKHRTALLFTACARKFIF